MTKLKIIVSILFLSNFVNAQFMPATEVASGSVWVKHFCHNVGMYFDRDTSKSMTTYKSVGNQSQILFSMDNTDPYMGDATFIEIKTDQYGQKTKPFEGTYSFRDSTLNLDDGRKLKLYYSRQVCPAPVIAVNGDSIVSEVRHRQKELDFVLPLSVNDESVTMVLSDIGGDNYLLRDGPAVVLIQNEDGSKTFLDTVIDFQEGSASVLYRGTVLRIEL